MQHIFLLLATYIALAADAGCSHALAIGDCRPPLMWLPIVLALTWFADARGVAWAGLVGLLADGLSDGRFGVVMLATTLTATMLLSVRPDDDHRSRWRWRVWQFAVIASGLILTRGLGSALSNGEPVTLDSLLIVAGEATYGVTLCALPGVLRFDAVLHSGSRDFRWSKASFKS